MEDELLSLAFDFAFSLFFGEEVERQEKNEVSQLWEEELDYVGEGRKSLTHTAATGPVTDIDELKNGSPRIVMGLVRAKLLHITCKFDFSLNFCYNIYRKNEMGVIAQGCDFLQEKYEYTPLYYGTPCQVRYYDAGCDVYIGGIAFQDQIICGCCGGNRKIQHIIDDAALNGVHWDDAIIELEWIDISEAIRGE